MIGMFAIIDSWLLLSCICYYLVISLFTALYFSLRSIIVHYRQLNHRQSGLIFRDLWALTRLVKHLPHAILTAKSCPASDGFRPSTVAVNLTLCTSQFQNRPPLPPRTIPGHLTRVKLRTVGNLTLNEARPVGHLTLVSKRLSAVGSKIILQFFDSAHKPRYIV